MFEGKHCMLFIYMILFSGGRVHSYQDVDNSLYSLCIRSSARIFSYSVPSQAGEN